LLFTPAPSTSLSITLDTSAAEHRLVAQEAQLSVRLGIIQAETTYLRAQLSSHESSVTNLESILADVRAELTVLRAHGRVV
jgi:hypothetical protein